MKEPETWASGAPAIVTLGRPGAGLSPIRGHSNAHSNVQGDRTMGIFEQPEPALLDAMEAEFGVTCRDETEPLTPRMRRHGDHSAEARTDGSGQSDGHQFVTVEDSNPNRTTSKMSRWHDPRINTVKTGQTIAECG